MDRTIRALLALVLLATALTTVATVNAGSQLDPAMVNLWERTDRPVADGAANRSWLWGPQANYVLEEPYTYAPLDENKRLVAYFDKSRMEITNPDGDDDAIWYVTNGRLSWELMTGRMQIGQEPDEFTFSLPATIPIAGDPYSWVSPTYQTMGWLMDSAPDATGEAVIATVDNFGAVGADLTPPAGVTNVEYITYPGEDGDIGHNIPDVFWNYLTEEISPLVPPADWLFVAGYPLTEAYWTRATVGGWDTDVLVQCYERRCLTYTPTNNDPYKVEMGNVGQHYYQWRHQGYRAQCYTEALRGFGILWREEDELRSRIGCPNSYNSNLAISTAYEHFERGMMVWTSVPDIYTPGVTYDTVLVMFNDGTYASYQDAWEEGQPVDDPTLVAPDGLYQPIRGFGKIWREAPGVRDRLGWATEPETGSSGGTQAFDAGSMILIDNLEEIFVFYGYFYWNNTGTWQVYTDPWEG